MENATDTPRPIAGKVMSARSPKHEQGCPIAVFLIREESKSIICMIAILPVTTIDKEKLEIVLKRIFPFVF